MDEQTSKLRKIRMAINCWDKKEMSSEDALKNISDAMGIKGPKEREYTKSEFELKNGLRSREELMDKHIKEVLDGLDDASFHSIYHLAWTLGSRKTLIDVKKMRVEQLESKNKELQRQIEELKSKGAEKK